MFGDVMNFIWKVTCFLAVLGFWAIIVRFVFNKALRIALRIVKWCIVPLCKDIGKFRKQYQKYAMQQEKMKQEQSKVQTKSLPG